MSFCVFLTALLSQIKTMKSLKGTQRIPLGHLPPLGLISTASCHQILEHPYFSTIITFTTTTIYHSYQFSTYKNPGFISIAVLTALYINALHLLALVSLKQIPNPFFTYPLDKNGINHLEEIGIILSPVWRDWSWPPEAPS